MKKREVKIESFVKRREGKQDEEAVESEKDCADEETGSAVCKEEDSGEEREEHTGEKNGDKENGRAESATELNAIYHGGKKAKIETRTANQEFNITESGTVGQSGRTAEE